MGLSAISNLSNHNNAYECKEHEETKIDLPPPTIPELTPEEKILQDWDECIEIFEIFN